MPIRVTQGMQYFQALSNIQRNYARLFETQDEIASGRRVRTPSDDPAGAARILEYARQAGDLAAFRSNISASRYSLESAAADVQAITDVFAQARERIVQALNDTVSDDDRAIIADEIDHLLASMLGHANANVDGKFTFGGSRTGAAPFVREVGPDGIERVRYVGDSFETRADVGPGISEVVNIPGSRLIDVGPRVATSYFGVTGARAGVGTDSGVGRARLVLAHALTGFGPQPGTPTDAPSGLRTGASSPARDTILGFSHVLNLSVDAAGTAGTVSLNGGANVAFTSADTDLAVTGPGGEAVHLDLSQLTPGFNGQVQLVSYGTISTDGGQTAVPIDFNSNSQRLVHADGSVTHLDGTAVKRAGVADVTYGGTLDVFNALLAIRDSLRVTGTRDEITGALNQAREHLDDLDRGQEALVRALANAGASSERTSALDLRLADLETAIAARRSEIEDADLVTLITALHENEAVYESSLMVTARLSRISLVNFL